MTTGRVVSKHSVYASFFFIDILTENGQVLSVMVQKHSEEYLPHVGDVIAFEAVSEPNDKGGFCLVATSIALVEKWPNSSLGPFIWKRTKLLSAMPIVACIQAQDDVLDRIKLYLEEKYVGYTFIESCTPVSKSQDRILVVHGDNEVEFCKSLIADKILANAVSRVYVMSNFFVGFTLNEIASQITAAVESPCSVRINAFPRWLDLALLESDLLKFSPTKFSHAISVVFVNGAFWACLLPAHLAVGTGVNIGGRCDNFISKAEAKLAEAWTRMGPFTSNSTAAIDVGASPGGWSAFLANVGGFANVVAVDKGAMHANVPASVEHWAMRGEDAIEKLLLEAKTVFSCYVCDMNCDLMETVALFISALPLMDSAARVILTFKQTMRNKHEWRDVKERGVKKLSAALAEKYATVRIKEIHLIANTPKETTVIADFHKIVSQNQS